MENGNPKYLNSCDMDKEKKLFALFIKKKKTGFGEFSSVSHVRNMIEINPTIVF